MEQPVSRKERERQVRKRTMLEAARTVIAEKGFKRATLDEIAQRAEFGKGTIYNYFPEGKDEMLFAILDEVYDDLFAISEATFGSADAMRFRERLLGYVDSFLGYFMRHQDLFVILMKEANRIAFSDDQSNAVFFKGHLERLIGAIEPAIARAIATGEVKAYPPESIAHMILGNVHGYLRYSCFRGFRDHDSESEVVLDSRLAAEFLCGILLDGLSEGSTLKVTANELERREG